MKNINLFLILVIAFSVACKKPATDILSTKKAELASKEKEAASLKSAIVKLKKEIEELDTTARSNAIAVEVSAIKTGNYKNPVNIQAIVESDKNVLISPEVPARIISILVKEGQRVSKGQTIATLDGLVAAAQIAELENAKSLAKINFDKYKALWEQNIGTEMQYLQAKNQYENLEKSITTAKTQLGKFTLRSPISGTVDEIMANVGELVGTMTGGAVARVVDISALKLKANVSEKYIGKLKVGQAVQVSYPSLGIEAEEKISAVGNVIDINNRTFSVYVTPTKFQAQLKPNMLTLITAYDYKVDEALTVPTKLVRNDGSNDFVLIAKKRGEKYIVEKAVITIDKQFASQTVVKSGITVGDLLITEGYNKVLPGDEVKIVPQETSL